MMQIGFTHKEAHLLARDVSQTSYKSVKFTGYCPPIEFINFSKDDESALSRGAYGYTSFPMGEYVRASKIAFDSVALELIHEDEFIEAIRHECAHVVAGFHAQHYSKWSRVLERMGGTGLGSFRIRNQRAFLDAVTLPEWERHYRLTQVDVKRTLDDWRNGTFEY